jgi:hypothetical protein
MDSPDPWREVEARDRYAARYIWGCVILSALLLVVVVFAGYLLAKRPYCG